MSPALNGTATCSLHVTWWYPRRSAASATMAISEMPASSSHGAWAWGRLSTTGVMIPSFMSAPECTVPGRAAHSRRSAADRSRRGCDGGRRGHRARHRLDVRPFWRRRGPLRPGRRQPGDGGRPGRGRRPRRADCIAPDLIPTPGVGPLEGDAVTTAPIGAPGHVDDVAAAAVFLAGAGARFVTGTTVHVDGGTWASGGWHRLPDGSWSP